MTKNISKKVTKYLNIQIWKSLKDHGECIGKTSYWIHKGEYFAAVPMITSFFCGLCEVDKHAMYTGDLKTLKSNIKLQKQRVIEHNKDASAMYGPLPIEWPKKGK